MNPVHVLRIAAVSTLLIQISRAQTATEPMRIDAVEANGVKLHYVEHGKGVPVILVHGGLEDYRSWEPQLAAFAQRHRTIAYSRRYNYPNTGAPPRNDYSAIVDADDLAALIKILKLAPANVVGISYGAYTALLLAVRHPELVRSLVLCEPPLLRWLPELDGDQPLFAEFMSKVWEPATHGFRESDEVGLTAAIDGFGRLGYVLGPETASFGTLPPEVRSGLFENAAEWKALTQSKDAFPNVPYAAVKRLRIPTLMLSGGKTLTLQKIIDPQLAKLLRHGKRIILPNASHEMWSEEPEACGKATLEFIDQH
jgi:non-heme chloroperoxidase